MFTDYIDAAMRYAQCQQFAEDQTYYCEVAACPGVWSNADTLEDALSELRDVLEGWILLGLERNEPIPAIDGIHVTADSAA